jgi:hypothetical protein
VAKRASFLPEAAWTVGGLIEARAHVTWHCDRCRGWGAVDLPAVASKRGRDFSLVDKASRCRQPDCEGVVRFRYAASTGTPSRPLKAHREREEALKREIEDREMEAAKAAYNAVARRLRRPTLP